MADHLRGNYHHLKLDPTQNQTEQTEKATEPTEKQSKNVEESFLKSTFLSEKESIGPAQKRKTPLDDENSQAKRLKEMAKIYENCKNLKLDRNLTNKTDQTEKSTEKPTEEQSKYIEKNS